MAAGEGGVEEEGDFKGLWNWKKGKAERWVIAWTESAQPLSQKWNSFTKTEIFLRFLVQYTTSVWILSTCVSVAINSSQAGAHGHRPLLAPVPQSVLMFSFSREALASAETTYAASSIKPLAQSGDNERAELNETNLKTNDTGRNCRANLNTIWCCPDW